GVWKWVFKDGKPYAADASHSASWNRGAYLVNGLGHCAECHSPRNFLGGIITAQRFAGGPNPEGEGWVPNITQKGIGTWSEKEIADFLETGEMPEGKTASVARRERLEGDDGEGVLDAGQHLHLLVDEVADVGVLVDVELHQQVVMAGRGVDLGGELGFGDRV